MIWEVLEEHLDVGGFLWSTWERTLGSPALRPAQVATRFEARLSANIEGLAVSSAIERLLLPALTAHDQGLVSTATSALLLLPDGLDLVLQALRSSSASARHAIIRALALSRRPGLEGTLLTHLTDADPFFTTAALEVLAFRRVDVGPALLPLLGASQPALQCAALRAASTSSQATRRLVELACASRLAPVRWAAIEAGLLLGFRCAWQTCRQWVDSGEPGVAGPLEMLALGGDAIDLPRLERGLDSPDSCPAALSALGYAGRAEPMDRILSCAEEHPALARLAGEAFSALSGIAVEGPLLNDLPPDPEPSEEEDLGANLDPGAEGELPDPDIEELSRRWRIEAARFNPGARYLEGQPFSPELLLATFVKSSMRRRRLLGFELAIRTRCDYWIETAQWTSTQLREERRVPTLRSEARLPFSRLLAA